MRREIPEHNEKMYLMLRSIFSTRADSISEFRENIAISRYVDGKSRNDIIELDAILKRLTQTRGEAKAEFGRKFKKKPKVAMNREEQLANFLMSQPLQQHRWDRRSFEERHPPEKPPAPERAGSSKGKVEVKVIGLEEVLRDLMELEKVLGELDVINNLMEVVK